MTSYSRGSPYGRKHSTAFHLVYRIEGGELVSLGLFETREKGEQELTFVNAPLRLHAGEWKIADLNCIGWGVIDGVVSRNGPDDGPIPLAQIAADDPNESLCTDWQRDA